MWIFGNKPKKNEATIVANDVQGDGPVNDSATSAEIQFPTPWTVRCQTPVKRAPLGKMWGNEQWDSYGGPWTP